ncbi:hypothetical protein BKA70DRAFT_1270977 [Coprinopsis sp. MPI-PUGE-AT-0042]|nr:hypothetical protein BKA70DRAFT_1270977 [Coprinopsis sp. MPI-PUGE-AT-0042]
MAKAHGMILPPPAQPAKKPTKPTTTPKASVTPAKQPANAPGASPAPASVQPPTSNQLTNQIATPKQKGGAASIVNRHIPCRVKGCEGMFKSPSGVAHHLESNVHQGIHRHTVTAVAQTMDIVPEISLNKRDALDASTITPLISYEAKDTSYNGKHFRPLASLHAHLNSAAHDDDEFKCPQEKCGRQFTLISALIQHVESETCGLTDMVQIQGWFDGLAAQFDRLLK